MELGFFVNICCLICNYFILNCEFCYCISRVYDHLHSMNLNVMYTTNEIKTWGLIISEIVLLHEINA